MIDKVSLKQKFELFSEHWSPKIVGECNGNEIKLAKLQGEFVWHRHEAEDELFMVISGRLIMKLHGQEDLVLEPGELVIIPRGIEHMPMAAEETHIMLFEPKGLLNTGDAPASDLTQLNPQTI